MTAAQATPRHALIMAGGTGGHIFPGLAVAQALRARGWQVSWLGGAGSPEKPSMESTLVPRHGFAFRTLDFSGVRGKGLVTLALLPLRELIRRIPTALTQLTPCLLMSPLSIAQYLTTDASTFDLVVFDEASQIPVWDAIGAIARGRQVVMVGDPRQLPPTNFFDRAESEFDEEDVEADLESILDECIGANLPTMNLAWHYRSRHESLIAFSNHRYYGGSLVTFPSPVTTDHAVSFHHVDQGVYEKGGARINKPEAKALVADLVERLQSPGFRESRLTIGVVTFNAEQQALIEDLLDEERRRDPSIEPHFADAELEPVFVKNLESVQGDERDHLILCTTFGPDAEGKFRRNFGQTAALAAGIEAALVGIRQRQIAAAPGGRIHQAQHAVMGGADDGIAGVHQLAAGRVALQCDLPAVEAQLARRAAGQRHDVDLRGAVIAGDEGHLAAVRRQRRPAFLRRVRGQPARTAAAGGHRPQIAPGDEHQRGPAQAGFAVPGFPGGGGAGAGGQQANECGSDHSQGLQTGARAGVSLPPRQRQVPEVAGAADASTSS